MSETQTFSPGMPVEVGRIEKELGQLWENTGDKTRASLINLAIYTEDAQAVAANTELIARIATEHACRAILVYGNHAAPKVGVKAWLNAHCHAVNKQEICSEQITFQLDGKSPTAFANVVFAHLDSDLPFCLWWQAPFREPHDAKLWGWVDRLIFDSNTWEQPAGQFPLVRRIAEIGDKRTILCDLNWTRLLTLRSALAQFFDNACATPCLGNIRTVEIVHAPGARLSALLLLGWLANQLGWTLETVLGRHTFRTSDHREITFELIEEPGACVSSCRLMTQISKFRVDRAAEGEFFHATATGGPLDSFSQMLPAGRFAPADILLRELGRGGSHPLYLKSLSIIEPLLQS